MDPTPERADEIAELRELLVAMGRKLDGLAALLAREPKAQPGYYSIRRAAKVLGVSRGRTLRALIARGLVRTVPKGSRVVVPRAEVERLLAEGLPSLDAPAPKRVRRRDRAELATDVERAVRAILAHPVD